MNITLQIFNTSITGNTYITGNTNIIGKLTVNNDGTQNSGTITATGYRQRSGFTNSYSNNYFNLYNTGVTIYYSDNSQLYLWNTASSDKRIKENITQVSNNNILDKLCSLNIF